MRQVHLEIHFLRRITAEAAPERGRQGWGAGVHPPREPCELRCPCSEEVAIGNFTGVDK